MLSGVFLLNDLFIYTQVFVYSIHKTSTALSKPRSKFNWNKLCQNKRHIPACKYLQLNIGLQNPMK